MSILYDEGQQAIAREARRVLDARTDKARLLGLLEVTGEYDRTFWQTCIEQGWTGLALPEEHGGLGLGLVELGIVVQSTGAATAGAPFLTTNYGAGEALLLTQTPSILSLSKDGPSSAASPKTERPFDKLRANGNGDEAEISHGAVLAHWLPKLATGEAIAATAFGEGNEPLPHVIQTQYADGVLTGTKPAVTAGLQADFAMVLAAQGGKPVLALAELAGVPRTAVDSFDNSRLYADLTFAGTPATLLAEGDKAMCIAREVLTRMAVVTAHEQLGGAEALMLIARDYANERKAFGQPIGAFQSVKHRIAELYGLVEIARANCIHAAARVGHDDFLAAAAAARLSATEAYDTAARDCVQIHGGAGVTWDSGLHLHMRRARSLAIECGNMFGWEDVLARELSGVAA